MAKAGGSSSKDSSRSKTKQTTQGQVVKLEPGNDRDYLCAHICFAKQNPIKGKAGQILNQRACTYAIWKQEEANELIWRYKAEVGYRTRDEPPSPIMSKKQPQRASRFPLGVAAREGMFKLSELETSATGRLRIPDVVILKVTDQELVNMRMQGKANWSKLIPVQGNIAKVVEIKFGNDRLTTNQRKAYEKIAGNANKFRLLEDVDCHCNLRNNNNHSGGSAIGAKYTYIQNTFVAVQLKQGQKALHPNIGTVQPLGTFLDQAPLYEIAVSAGSVVVIVGAIALAPAAGAVGAALAGYMLVTN